MTLGSFDCAVIQTRLLKGQKIKQLTGYPDVSDRWCISFFLPPNVKKLTSVRKVASATPSGNKFYPSWLLIRVRLEFFPTPAQGASLWLHPQPSSIRMTASVPKPACPSHHYTWLAQAQCQIAKEARHMLSKACWSEVRIQFLKIDVMFILHYLGKKENSKRLSTQMHMAVLALKIESTKKL